MEIGLDLDFDIGDALNLPLPMDDSVSVEETPSETSTSEPPQSSKDGGNLDVEISKVKATREYNLRTTSIINRIQTERRKSSPKVPKPKTKPAPLSKYRRRTANSRERGRMQEINEAFETLRHVIPDYPANGGKLTKITTLRLAMNYIAALRDLLHNDDGNLRSDSSNAGTSSDACCSPCSSGGGEVSVGGSVGSSVSSESSSDAEHFSLSLGDLDSEGESLLL